MRTIPESLSRLREQLGLNQGDFAKKIKISRPYLSKLENSHAPLSGKIRRRVLDVCRDLGMSSVDSASRIRSVALRSWAQAGAGFDFEELPLDWQKQVPTDCPDDQAFAVTIQGDSMEPKYSPGDIAILMPSYKPFNGSLVVARLEKEGVVFKVFTAREKAATRICSFTSYNSVFQPIEVPESNVVWNYPVYQITRQIWR